MSSYISGGQDPEPPITPESEIQPPNFTATGQNIGDGIGNSSLLAKIEKAALYWFEEAASWLAYKVLTHLGNVLLIGADIVVKTRGHLDELLAKIASEGISDMFGQEIEDVAFSKIGDSAGRKEIASVLGKQILNGLALELSDSMPGEIKPSDAPAKAYLTRMAELSVQSWFQEAVTNFFSPHPLEKFGEFGEDIARLFGFERLSRRVLSPAVDILVAQPYEMQLNKDYRPKMLSASLLTRLMHRGKLSEGEVREELARQGYAEWRIEGLINESSKFVSAGDLGFLVRHKMIEYDAAIAQLRDQGYAQNIAETALELERLSRLDSAKNDFISAATSAYVDRDIDSVKYAQFLDQAGVEPEVLDWMRRSASLRRESNDAKLSEAKAEAAVEQGFWTIQRYTDYLKDKGYVDEDVTTMQLLLQEKIKEDTEAASKRDKAEKQRAAEKAARDVERQQRKADLEAARSHKDLSLTQVEQAYVRGFLTEDDYRRFLQGEKFSLADIQTLMDLAESQKSAFADAQDRKDAADRKLAATQLTTSQLQQAVEIGALTLANFQSILAGQGVDAADIAILSQFVMNNIAEKKAAADRRAKIEAELAVKNVSLAQMEQAVRRGLRTQADYKKFLGDAGYAAEDQGILAGLLDAQIVDDKEAEKKRAAIEADLQNRRISLADLEQAVRRKIATIDDYRAALQREHVVPADIETLVKLLQSKMADDEAAARRRKDVEDRLAQKGISLSDLERAVVLGIASLSRYQQTLTQENVPAADASIMVALVQVDQATYQKALAAQRAAALKLQNRPVSLADLERSVQLKLKSIDDYRRALSAEGFSADAVDLMSNLLQATIAQIDADKKAAAGREQLRSQRPASLAEVEKAVRLGVRTMDDYRAALKSAGLTASAQDLLAESLQEELDRLAAASARREDLDAEKTVRELSRADMERTVKAGVRTIYDYREFLQKQGYSLLDQAALEDLLLSEMK